MCEKKHIYLNKIETWPRSRQIAKNKTRKISITYKKNANAKIILFFFYLAFYFVIDTIKSKLYDNTRLIHDLTLEIPSGIIKLSQHAYPDVGVFFFLKNESLPIILTKCDWPHIIIYRFNKILKQNSRFIKKIILRYV